MNEFKYLAEVDAKHDGESDLLALSMRLAVTPCGPLYKRHIVRTVSLPPSAVTDTYSV
jgi:hypothetical protein